MKKVVLALTFALALSGVTFATTNQRAEAATGHNWMSTMQYKSEAAELHFPYVNGQVKQCTIYNQYVRDYAECVNHPGEVEIGAWMFNGQTHSLSH
ncbi:hypothetical protein [Tumebacillus lipolyticus]|uniref:Uncharacterized protein n=1 Tax=Tumebacillus lipolyticus TaxID=1280370 RepID=A0ABW4ZS32_9BACL